MKTIPTFDEYWKAGHQNKMPIGDYHYNAARDAGLEAIAERDARIAELESRHQINCTCANCEDRNEVVRGIMQERDAEIAKLNRMVDALVNALDEDIPHAQNVETHWRDWAEQKAKEVAT